MIIIGIDPGTTDIGYGVIEKEGGRLTAVDYGVIKTTGSQSDKLLKIDEEISRLIEKYRPDLASIETLFFSTNKKTAMTVSEARGAITLIFKKAGVPIKEFSPNNVKSIVTGYGRSDKDSVRKVVAMTLGIKNLDVQDDASDALALALRGAADMR